MALFQLPWLPETTLGAAGFAGLRSMMQDSARPGTFGPGDLDRYAETWSHPSSLTAMLNDYRALRERTSRQKPKQIITPTLVLWGEKDSFLDQHVARADEDLRDDGRLVILTAPPTGSI